MRIYNTLTRRKDEFVPIEPGKVRIYVCGMTVYDYCHLGHARVMVVFDTVVRYLRHLGYAVTYVRNITDIDDKIIQRALKNGESVKTLTDRFVQAMHEDERALAVLPPDLEPRATESIADIIALISRLQANGSAYVGSSGDVFFSVSGFEHYGALSGKHLEDLRAGERVDVDNAKRDPMDFVLWKMAKPDEPSWVSPWGAGRPGWHIECSAMALCHLGNHFDIHGGGMDLQFPHHENEIAQSEAATGEPFVNYWMHNGFVRVNEEKMSKSLGNFFTVRDVLARYRPETVRFFILNSHYRSPLNYSDENLDEAHAALARLYTAVRGVERLPKVLDKESASFIERFEAAMQDDFNTPLAISVLFELTREINRQKILDTGYAGQLAATLLDLAAVIGLLTDDPEVFFKHAVSNQLDEQAIASAIQQRLLARKEKNWAESDRLRDELKSQGVILEDSAQGTTWRRE
jgi:cysteinyl-tRNA synthetase